MFNELIAFNRNPNTDFIFKSGLSLMLMIVLGPVVIDSQTFALTTVPGVAAQVPITLQSFVIILVAVFWGWKIGTLATFLYILCGGFGLKVFAGYQSGWDRVFGEFGGFFFGFVVAALVVGLMAENEKFRKPIPHLMLWITGHAIILAMGGLWLMGINPESGMEMLKITLSPALLKSAVGFFITRISLRLAMRRREIT